MPGPGARLAQAAGVGSLHVTGGLDRAVQRVEPVDGHERRVVLGASTHHAHRL